MKLKKTKKHQPSKANLFNKHTRKRRGGASPLLIASFKSPSVASSKSSMSSYKTPNASVASSNKKSSKSSKSYSALHSLWRDKPLTEGAFNNYMSSP